MAGEKLGPSAWVKFGPRLTRVIVPPWLTKTSLTPLVSPGTRLVASDVKATTCPLSETAACPAPAGPRASDCAPPLFTLTRVVSPVESPAAAWAGRGATTPTRPADAGSRASNDRNTPRRSRPAIRPPSVIVGLTLPRGRRLVQ